MSELDYDGVLEFDESDKTLIATDRLGPNEYGASAVVAEWVEPKFGRWIAKLVAERATQAEAGLDVERLAEAIRAAELKNVDDRTPDGRAIRELIGEDDWLAQAIAREYAALSKEPVT